MALPDTFKVTPGTAVIWGEAGGSGVTHTLSLDALADGTARMGAVADLGASWDMDYSVMLVVETAHQCRRWRADQISDQLHGCD